MGGELWKTDEDSTNSVPNLTPGVAIGISQVNRGPRMAGSQAGERLQFMKNKAQAVKATMTGAFPSIKGCRTWAHIYQLLEESS